MHLNKLKEPNLEDMQRIESNIHFIIHHLESIKDKGEKFVQLLQEYLGLFEVTIIFKEPNIDFLPSWPTFHYSTKSGKAYTKEDYQQLIDEEIINPDYDYIPLIKISEAPHLKRVFQNKVVDLTHNIADFNLKDKELQVLNNHQINSIYFVPLTHDEETFGLIACWTQTGYTKLQFSPNQGKFVNYLVKLFTPDFHILFLKNHLNLTNSRLGQIFDQSPDIFMFIKLDGTILDVNSKFEEILKYQRENVLGTNIKDIINEGELDEINFKFENPGLQYVLFKTAEDEDRLLEISCFSQLDSGDHNYVFLLARDQAERQGILSEIIQAEKIKSLGLLAGGIAHDFNNYLAAIEANTSLLSYYVDEEHEEIEKILENIHLVVEKSQRLTKQLVTFSQGGNIHPELLNIEESLHEVVLFTLTGTDIVSTITSSLNYDPFVYGDIGLLSQVFTNIILNSREALVDKLQKRIDIDISEALDPKYIEITIKDNGVGIPSMNLEKIFDPFYSYNKPEGSGLGLSTSKSIIKEHNGQIFAESEEGKFTKVIVKLPRVDGKIVTEQESNITQIDTSNSIWILDDVKEIRVSLEKILSIQGQIVLTFEKGEELIQELETTTMFPNLLILDMTNKKGFGGRRVLEELRFRQIDQIPILFISGYAKDMDFPEFESMEKIEFLSKPIKEEDLIELIHKLI